MARVKTAIFDNSAPVVTLDGKDLVELTEPGNCTEENGNNGAKAFVNNAKGGWLPKNAGTRQTE